MAVAVAVPWSLVQADDPGAFRALAADQEGEQSPGPGGPSPLLAVDEQGASVLHHAAAAGSVRLLDALVQRATLPSHPLHQLLARRSAAGASPLAVAAYRGQVGALGLLLAHPVARAEVAARDQWKQSPLHYAALGGSAAAVQALRAAGADLEAQCERGATPLALACAAGQLEAARALLRLGANANAKDWREARPAHYAVYHGRPALLELLREHGAALGLRDRDGLPLLHYAALGGDLPAFRLVLTLAPAELGAADRFGRSPLHAAAAVGAEGVAGAVLERAGDGAVRLLDERGSTPLHVACAHGRLALARLLLARAPDLLDSPDAARATPLLKAAHAGAAEVVAFLLERGAAAEACDGEGAGVLHHAAWAGSAACLGLLLDARPQLASAIAGGDAAGATPLHKAAHRGHAPAARLLLQRGALAAARDAGGGQALHNAACGGHVACLRVLLEHREPRAPRLDPNAPDAAGRTALHLAAAAGQAAAVELLRAYGADVGRATADGRTALYYALRRGRAACVVQLLQLGARFSRADRRALSPADVRALQGLVPPDPLRDLLRPAHGGGPGPAEPALLLASPAPSPAAPVPHAHRRRGQGSRLPGLRRATGAAAGAASGAGAGERPAGLSEEALRARVVEAFNARPRAGVAQAVAWGLAAGGAPGDVARFLRQTPGLDKAKIGELLGEPDEAQQEVLAAFVALTDYAHMDLDIALRRLLTCFRLPGEAQKIDRIMQKFARQYYADNAEGGAFASADAVYVLAFAAIMLNTDAHNPAVRREAKMRREQFVANGRGMNGGRDFAPEVLEELYGRVVEEEIRMELDQLAHPTALKKAWLLVANNRRERKAQRRHAVLTSDPTLLLYTKLADESPLAVVPLRGARVGKEPGKKWTIRVEPPEAKDRDRERDKEEGGAVAWSLQAASDSEFAAWLRALADLASPPADRARRGGPGPGTPP